MCANPSAPPPLNTKAIFCRSAVVCGECFFVSEGAVVCWSFCSCAAAKTPRDPAAKARLKTSPRQNAKFNMRSPCLCACVVVFPESCRFFRCLQGFVPSPINLILGTSLFPAASTRDGTAPWGTEKDAPRGVSRFENKFRYSDLENYRHNQRSATRALLNKPLQIGPDFLFDDPVVGLLFAG
jgi:hypothetical protein